MISEEEKGYNGNVNLKKINKKIGFTQANVFEYAMCAADPIYFIEKYCKVISLDDGLVDLILFSYQKEMITAMHENRFVISKWARQLGKSTVVAAYIVHYTIFNDNVTTAILANKAPAAREVMSRIQLMYEYLPSWIQEGVVVWNKGNIELENGSKIFTGATTGSSVRGKSVNFLYIDEMAIIPNTIAEEFFASTYPTISSGNTTKIVITSTPLGYNHFWKFWKEATEGKNGFIPITANWWDHPKRDQAWADQQLAILGQVRYNQEVLTSFIGSSNTLISGEKISQIPISDFIYSKDGLDVIEKPKPLHAYVMIVDTAKGVGGDYSAFTVIDITAVPYKIVAKYRDRNISPMLYPTVIYKIGTEYNNAYALIEINSSEQVATILYNDLEYENVLLVHKTTTGQSVSSFGPGRTYFGINTDKKIKRIGCQNLKSLIEENKLLIGDADIVAELSTFIETKGSYAADSGYHDDLVMTLVLFSWLTTQSYFKELNDIDLRKTIYSRQIEAIENSLTPFGFMSDGLEDDYNADGSITLANF